MKKIVSVVAVSAGLAFGLATPATAADVPCGTPKVDAVYTTVVTPGKPAVPGTPEKTIEHPAVTETVEHPAVTETRTVVVSPGVWANWAPNDTQGPQDYEPIWPIDERGTWILHDKLPEGHADGADGVYKQGNGNSPYFYRQAPVTRTETVVVKEAWTEVKVIKEAWTEVVPAVPGTPEVEEKTERVLVTPEVPAGPECPVKPEEPVTPEKPVSPEKPVTVVDKPQVVTQKRVNTFVDKTPAPQELARTGSDNLPLGLLAASLLGLGFGAYALRKRLN